LATKHSASPVFNQKAWLRTRLIADIDLSIFGQSEKKFDEYERQIRKEYEWISEDDFVVGRSAILKSFLDRPKIYLTQILRTKYEVQARRNISRSIDNRR